MASSPLTIGDDASMQEDEASSSPSRDDAQHSHSDATAEDDIDNDDNATDEDEDGVDSDQSKIDLSLSDDESQEHAADERNSLSSENEASSENDEDQDQPSKSGEEDTVSSASSLIKLGGPNGSNGTPAYALLVGMVVPEVNSIPQEIISIPITRLPTTLGKDHTTKDPSFVGLKECSNNNSNDTSTAANENAPRLSQSMCCIFYRDAHGGKLGLYKKGRKKENDTGDEKGDANLDQLDGMIYKPRENNNFGDDNERSSSASSPDDILRLPDMDDKAALPTSGFYAIECTGRKIMVGGRVIKKGQVAMLKDGMPIKIASHCLYFLLPTSPSSASLKPPPSIKVKVATTQIKAEKVGSNNATEKKEWESTGGSTDNDNTSSLPPPSKKPRKSEEFQSFDDKSDQQLLQLLSQKVTETSWDHEGQKLGSTLATRVCRAAAKSTEIQIIVRDEGGVTQREIIDWMNDPINVFRDYERMMLAKIVEKSFMMSMGKAILRAGYTKNEYLSGRAFRWNLPEDVLMYFMPNRDGQGTPSSSSLGNIDLGESNVALSDVKEEETSIQSKQDDEDSENMELLDEEAEEGVNKSGEEINEEALMS